MALSGKNLEKPKPKVIPPKIFGSLLTEVVKKDLCVGCGACVASCPVSILYMKDEDEKPSMKGKCILCEYCYYQCPRTIPRIEELEESIFGRKRRGNEEIGVYIDCYSARSKVDEILKVCQDGGIVTTLLNYALSQHIIDGAVVSKVSEEEPWKPLPEVVYSPQDLLKYAATRYTTSPTLIGLASAVEEYNMKRVAVVGTPCQIEAVRKMQFSSRGVLKLGSKATFTIGLFCMESFWYTGLINSYLVKKKGLDLTKISKFNKSEDRFIVQADGEELINVPITEIKAYVRGNCHSCGDLTAEYADISVGADGSPEGWSTVIVRTGAGKKLFDEAVKAGLIEYKSIEKVKPGLKVVKKLTKEKRESPTAT